ncbi:hypothetical protein RND71_023114 [Anisodus tanguticus]|uniref:Uncharacterized protein n=1 Tax=Anisodus tanguticus TaxID=243964 RepID=A0AAE1VDI1_9SOLA|nr:hypothetical protein RND71_023114 [Anisodus tanguticus]
MKIKNKFVNHARNVWDRAVTCLPRVDQLCMVQPSTTRTSSATKASQPSCQLEVRLRLTQTQTSQRPSQKGFQTPICDNGQRQLKEMGHYPSKRSRGRENRHHLLHSRPLNLYKAVLLEMDIKPPTCGTLMFKSLNMDGCNLPTKGKFPTIFTLISFLNQSICDPRATEAALICSNTTAAQSDRQVYVASFLAALDSVTPLVAPAQIRPTDLTKS